MKMMKLNSNIGIAGSEQFNTLDDVLKFTPYLKIWNWNEGQSEDSLEVTAILKNGQYIKLNNKIHIGDASNKIPDYNVNAQTIGEQISNMEVNILIFKSVFADQSDNEIWEEFLPVKNINWNKIKKHIETALRKTDDKEIIFTIANKLNVM